MPEKEQGQVPERILERYLLGELSARERRRVERILRQDPGAAARLDALQRSNDEILAAYPPGEMAAKIRARLAASSAPAETAPPARGFHLPSFALPLAAAAMILIAILPLRNALGTRDETRAKGLEARLEIYRQEQEDGRRLAPGAVAAAGDLLQIAYVSGGAGYGLIFSLDGRGAVTFHYPRPGEESQAGAAATAPPLQPGGETALPYAYRLDDAPAFERFFLVSSAEPFALEPILKAAESLAADPAAARRQDLDLGPGLEQASFLVIKENSP
jgi:hypothetical protein